MDAQMFLSGGLNPPSPKLQFLQISSVSVIEPHTVLGRKDLSSLSHPSFGIYLFHPLDNFSPFQIGGGKKDKTEAQALQLFSSSLQRPCFEGALAA